MDENQLNQLVIDMKTIVAKFKKQKVVICGHPEAIEKAKKIIDSDKDEFAIYDFHFMPNEYFEKDNLYMVTDEKFKDAIIKLMEKAEKNKENKSNE